MLNSAVSIGEASLARRLVLSELEALAEEYVSLCHRCGLCARICPVYRATGNPRYTPLRRLVAAVRVARGEVNSEDVEALFTCTTCGACTLPCPLGLDLWALFLLARAALAMRGLAPRSLLDAVEAAARSLHSFTEDRSKALQWLEEWVPRDTSADYLYVPTPVENVFYPHQAKAKAKLLAALGVNYTVSTRAVDLGGNMAVDLARPDIAVAALQVVLEEADRLGVKYVIVSECGADHKWALKLAPLILGWRELGRRFKPIHVVIAERLRPLGAAEDGVGLFASCTFARVFPLYNYVRRIALAAAGRVLEPKWAGRTVLCCGGSCLNVIREKWARQLRVRVTAQRIAAYEELGAREILVPCTKCYIAFRQAILKLRKRGMTVKLVSEKLLEVIERASPRP